MDFNNNRYIVLFFLMLFSGLVSAQKTDTLIHINGNVMTGEIKKMTDGILYFKMNGMGTISVEADKILTYKTRKLLQIRTKQGSLIFGNVDTSITKGYVKVGYGVNKETVRVLDIIELFPIKTTFWLRLSGNFDFGLDYRKSTNMLKSNASGRVDYRNQKMSSNFSWTNISSAQALANDSIVVSEKTDASFEYKRFIKGKWLWVGSLGMNSNSELGLNLRLFLGLAIQNDLLQTTKNHLFWQVGANLNREYPTEGEIIENPEGFLALSYNIYKFSRPEVKLMSNISAYPNLTFNGRWRVDTNIDLNVELFYNFYVGFKIYSNYDSKPSSENASKTDWGMAFSVGYSFH